MVPCTDSHSSLINVVHRTRSTHLQDYIYCVDRESDKCAQNCNVQKVVKQALIKLINIFVKLVCSFSAILLYYNFLCTGCYERNRRRVKSLTILQNKCWRERNCDSRKEKQTFRYHLWVGFSAETRIILINLFPFSEIPIQRRKY